MIVFYISSRWSSLICVRHDLTQEKDTENQSAWYFFPLAVLTLRASGSDGRER